MIKIAADDLARVCNNAMMFVNPKSLRLPGEVYFYISTLTERLEVFACDDYFAITDSSSIAWNQNKTEEHGFVLSLNDVKGYTKNKEKHEGLEEFSRRFKKEEIGIIITDDAVTFMAGDEALTFNKGVYREGNWNIVEGLIYSDEVHPVSITGFSSNPERYAKFSQLKYDKKTFGINWNFVETQTGVLLVRFDIGPTIRGVIRPLEEVQDSEAFVEEDDVESSVSIPD